MELREFRAELPSTQTEATRRAREGAPVGTRVVAARQTAGQGRGSHIWASPVGNVYLSLVLPCPPTHRSILSLAVGVRLRTALFERYGVPTSLKWPNDLLVAGPNGTRKLAGILVDVVPSPTLGTAAVVGVGVNVRAPLESYPPELRGRVAGLDEWADTAPDLGEVEELVVSAIHSAVDALATAGGAADVLEECRSSLHGVGRRATIDAAITGVIRGVGEEGELLLDTPSGAIVIRAGNLVLEES
ncbi:MAG: biotin--[acetyl-CoA-carboxylase] ligase [Thermoplasmata archaeon]|nr:biotin--[acetyl-CoA-carboxylase] ligase [Thermoplasmata archaeon]